MSVPALWAHDPAASIGRVVDGALWWNERGLRLLDDVARCRGCTREKAAWIVAWHAGGMVAR